MAAKSKKSDTKRYADPVTCKYIEADMQAPIDKSPETAFGVTEAEYQNYPNAIKESLERPVDPVDEANEAINKDYPWAVPSMTSTQRAILCELYRIRKALEAK